MNPSPQWMFLCFNPGIITSFLSIAVLALIQYSYFLYPLINHGKPAASLDSLQFTLLRCAASCITPPRLPMNR